MIDQWLFYIQTAIRQSKNQTEKVELLLAQAKAVDNEIQTVTDLKKLPIEHLNYFANQQISSHQMLSVIQGGVTGSGHTLLLSIDLPLMIVINLRAVQLIAASYGYDPKEPFEMMIALKVFHCATLPKRFQKRPGNQLLEEVCHAGGMYFYEGNENIVNQSWLTRLLLQIVKWWFIKLFRKNKRDGLSSSASVSERDSITVTKTVTRLAKNFINTGFVGKKRQIKSLG